MPTVSSHGSGGGGGGGSSGGSGSNSRSSPSSSSSADGRIRTASSGPSKALDVSGIESLLSSIPAEFQQASGFNPFKHYDDSVDDLNAYHDTVREAIELIVDVHHKGFNTATAAFSRVVDSFADSQRSVDRLLELLAESRRLLTSRNEELKDLWQHTQTLTLINATLDKLAYIVAVPVHLQALTDGRMYLHAVNLITATLAMLGDDDLREVEGLLELREDIINRKNSIVAIIIEQLHVAVYLKTTRDAAASADRAADRDGPEVASSVSAEGSGEGRSGQRAAPGQGEHQGGAGPSALTVGSLSSATQSASSTSGTLSFLLASPFSPFCTNRALPADMVRPSSVETEALYRPIPQLLADERSPSYLAAPFSVTSRLLSLLVAALDLLHALPAAKTQITKRVRTEVAEIIEAEKQACRERRLSATAAKRRILAQPDGREQQHEPSQNSSSSGNSVTQRSTAGGASSSSVPLSIRPGASAASSPLPRPTAVDREVSSLFLSRVFPVLLSVLRNHVDVIALINSRQRMAQVAAVAPSKGKAGSGKPAVEREDPRWNIGSVWATIQIEVQLAAQEMLLSAAVVKLSSASLSAASKPSKTAGGGAELTFSFDDSSAPSIARMSRGKEERTAIELLHDSRRRRQAQRQEQKAVLAPTPYNLALLYRPLLHFSQQAQAIISGAPPQRATAAAALAAAKADSGSQLVGFLHLFTSSSYLPRLQADVNIAVDAIFADSHAFEAVEASSSAADSASAAHGLSSPLRLRCVLAVKLLLDVLLSDVQSLPHAVAEYMTLISAVVTRLSTRCYDRYQEVCRGVYSAQRLLDPNMLRHMEHEQAYTQIILQQQQRGADDDTLPPAPPLSPNQGNGAAASDGSTAAPGSSVSGTFNAVLPLYAPFFSADFTLRSEQLLADSRAVSDVCLIQSSVEWLADSLYAWTQQQQQQHAAPPSPHAAPDTVAAHSKKGKERKQRKGGSARTKASAPSSPVVQAVPVSPLHQPPPSFRLQEQQAKDNLSRLTAAADTGSSEASSAALAMTRAVLPLCSSLLALSTRCLLTLRFELQCALFAFLGLIRQSSYALTATPSEPEPFVLALNAQLAAFDDAVARRCPSAVRRYVQRDALTLVSVLCRRFVSQLHDRRMSTAGVAQLHIDLFAVQQQLVNALQDERIAETEAAAFDLAVYYLDLLLCSEDELMSGEHSQHFTRDELQAVHTLSRQQQRH